MMSQTDPFDVTIHPSGPLGGYLQAPPSKNYTTRLILGAVLAEGESFVRQPAANDDALALVRCARALGAVITEETGGLRVRGVAGRPVNPGRLNPGNAGAVLRLLLGTACLAGGEVEFVTDYPQSLGKRPNRELLDALTQLGAHYEAGGPDGQLPIRIDGSAMRGGRVRVSGARSSQFLSSLLYLTPFLSGESMIEVGEGHPQAPRVLVSRPLIDQTLDSLARLGLELYASENRLDFRVPGGQVARAGELAVNADWPSAAALLASVAAAGGMATIHGLREDAQGERRAADFLSAMGCEVLQVAPQQWRVHSTGELTATNFNGDLATDAVLALVGAACLARGTSRFEGIANLALKECDRIAEPLAELAKLGVTARHGADWIEIDGRPEGYEGGITVSARGDHRVAQLLAIVGMRSARGLTITGAQHISKSYPEFFEDLTRLGVKLELHSSRQEEPCS